jgi:hypothetical protein
MLLTLNTKHNKGAIQIELTLAFLGTIAPNE